MCRYKLPVWVTKLIQSHGYSHSDCLHGLQVQLQFYSIATCTCRLQDRIFNRQSGGYPLFVNNNNNIQGNNYLQTMCRYKLPVCMGYKINTVTWIQPFCLPAWLTSTVTVLQYCNMHMQTAGQDFQQTVKWLSFIVYRISPLELRLNELTVIFMFRIMDREDVKNLG